MTYFSHYRKSSIGQALEETCEELLEASKITPELKVDIMNQFDKSINEALKNVKNKVTFKGHCKMYRLVDDVYLFCLDNATFKTDNRNIEIDNVKIVACDGRTTSSRTKKSSGSKKKKK